LGVDRHRQCGELDAGDGHRVAGAIKRRRGIIEEEAIRQGPVEVGEAVLTTGGNLPHSHHHAAVMGPGLKTDAEKIAAPTRAVLAPSGQATAFTSLALPALERASAMSRRRCPRTPCSTRSGPPEGSPTGLKRVIFVLYQDDAYKAFTDTLKRLGGVQ